MRKASTPRQIVKSTGVDVATTLSRALSGPEGVPTVKAKSRTTTFASPLLGSQQQRRPPDGTTLAPPNPPRVARTIPVLLSQLCAKTHQFLSSLSYLRHPNPQRSTCPVPIPSRLSPIHGGSGHPAPLPTHRADTEPLVDRFGFLYDVALYDAVLLVLARTCRCAAPACLTSVKIADRTEDEHSNDKAGGAESRSSKSPAHMIARWRFRPVRSRGRRRSAGTDSQDLKSRVWRRDVPASSSNNGSRQAMARLLWEQAHIPRCLLSAWTHHGASARTCCGTCSMTARRSTTNNKRHSARSGMRLCLHGGAPTRRRCHQPRQAAALAAGILAKALLAAGGAAALLGLDGPVAEDKLAHSDGLIGIAQLGGLRGARSAGSSAGWCAAGCRGMEMQEPAGADGQRWWGGWEIDQDVGWTRPA